MLPLDDPMKLVKSGPLLEKVYRVVLFSLAVNGLNPLCVAPEALTTSGVLELVDTWVKSTVSPPALPLSWNVSVAGLTTGPATKMLSPPLDPVTLEIPTRLSQNVGNGLTAQDAPGVGGAATRTWPEDSWTLGTDPVADVV